MFDLNQMAIFIRVVDEGGFTSAGRLLGIPKSRVSRMISDLENKLGVRLLQRSTRQISMTEVGQQYYQQYKPLFGEIVDIHQRIADQQDSPHGVLRVACPIVAAVDVFGQWNVDYLKQHPDVRLEFVHLENEFNLINDGFDLGFIVGDLEDSSLIARRIDETDPILCASPEYLAQAGDINHPQDLDKLDWVMLADNRESRTTWQLTHGETDETYNAKPNARIKVNILDYAKQALMTGMGIGVTSYFLAGEEILNGQLVPILPEWKLKPEPVYMVFPSNKYLSKKVRSYIDFYTSRIDQINDVLEGCSPEQQMDAFNRLYRGKETR